MAERLAYLEAVVGADVTAFRRGMQQIRNETGILSESIKGISGAGRAITLGFAVPMAAIGTAAGEAAMEFDAHMRNINAIAGMTQNELDELGASVLNFGADTREGANAAADALYTVYSAGVTNVKDAFGIMEVATRTAEAGLSDLTVTTESLTSVLLAYGDTSEETAWKTSNAITAMVGVGVGSMEEFANALGNVVPTASAMNMSFDELAGNMAYLTQRGLSAAKASTSLNAALSSLAKPTKAMEAAFNQLGVSGAEQLITKFGGVNNALQALIGTTDGTQASLQAMFNNIRGARAINLFANDIEGWNAALAEFNESLDGATMRAWESQMQSFAAEWDLLSSAVEAAGITIGSELLPMLSPAVGMMTDALRSVMELNPEIIQMGIAFTAATAGVGLLMWSLSAFMSPIGVVAGAVAALAVAFHTNFGGIKDTVVAAVEDITGGLQPLTDALDTFFSTIFPEDINGDDVLNFDDLGITGVELDMNDYITIEATTSLWDLFVGQGYRDYFSWDEFMVAARAGGWTGGALEVGDMLTIDMSGTDAVFDQFGNSMQTGLGGEFDTLNGQTFSVAPEIEDTTLRGRFETAVTNLWGDLEPALSGIITNITTWVNTNGALALNALAGLFTGSSGEGGNTPIYQALTTLFEGDLIGAIDTIIPGAATHLQGLFGTDFGNAINNVFPDLSAAITNLLTSAGNWLVNEGIPTMSRAAGFVMASVGSALVSGVSTVFDSLTSGGGLEAGANGLGQTVVTPFAEGFSDGISAAGGDVASNPIESMLTGLAGGIATMAIARFAIFGGAARSVVFAFNMAMAAVKMSATAAFFVTKIGLSLAAAAMSSVAPGLAATAFVGKFSAAFASGGVLASLRVVGASIIGLVGSGMTAAAGAVTSFASAAIGGIVSALSTAAAGITAAAPGIAAIGASILSAIGTIITSPISLGIALGSLLYLNIPQEFKDGLRNGVSEILDGVFGEGTFDGMLGGFEQSMYALMAHLSYFIGNFDGRFNDIGDNFVGMIDNDIAERFMLNKPEPLSREWTINPLFEADTMYIREDMPELSAQIADALPDDMVISGADFQAILNAQMLLDPTIATSVDADFVMQEFTAGNFQDYEQIYRQSASDFIEGMDLDGLTVDWTNTETTIAVDGFMPQLDLSGGSLTMLDTEQIASMATDVQSEISNAINNVMGAVTAAGDGSGEAVPTTTSISSDIFNVDTLNSDAEAYNTALGTTMTTFGTTIMDNIGSGTTMDSQAIIDQFLTPLESAWLQKFGDGSAMASAFDTFSTQFVTGMGAMGMAQVALLATSMVSMPAITQTVMNGLSNMMSSASKAGQEIWNLQAAIGALLGMSGSLNVQVNVSGSVGVDGSHRTGLGYVPKDGYIAELHKGERVLTAQEAKAYNSSETMASGINSTVNNSSQVNNNSINITGVQDVDSLIQELDRRGIYIG